MGRSKNARKLWGSSQAKNHYCAWSPASWSRSQKLGKQPKPTSNSPNKNTNLNLNSVTFSNCHQPLLQKKNCAAPKKPTIRSIFTSSGIWVIFAKVRIIRRSLLPRYSELKQRLPFAAFARRDRSKKVRKTSMIRVGGEHSIQLWRTWYIIKELIIMSGPNGTKLSIFG